MHVAFALMLGWPLARLVAHRVWSRSLWLLYPLLVTFVIVATGNHFWFDAFLGAMTAGVVGLRGELARARRGRRCGRWSRRRGPASARPDPGVSAAPRRARAGRGARDAGRSCATA